MRVVFHADDFGLNRAVSDGVVCGFAHGLLTSASVLANAPDAPRALEQWKCLIGDWQTGKLPSTARRRTLDDPPRPFDLGVHLNLTQGRPLSGDRYPPQLLDKHGNFPGVYSLFRRLRGLSAHLRAAISEELARQVQLVVDHGLQPTHLNGHQYIEMIPPLAGIVAELLPRFHIGVVRVALERPPLATVLRGGTALPQYVLGSVKRVYAKRFRQQMDRLGLAYPDAFFGTMHAGRVDLPAIRLFLRRSERFRLVEIAMHPGETSHVQATEDETDGWHDPLSRVRPNELQTLRSCELFEFLQARQMRLGRLTRTTETDG